MKDIKDYIYEEQQDKAKWIAIAITTKGDSVHNYKDQTSERVVTIDTYYELQDKGVTKGGYEILSISALGHACKSKEDAETFLSRSEKKPRKTKIDKGDAKYIVWAMNIGKMNPTGKTIYDWNFFTDDMAKNASIYMGKYGRSFLWGAKGGLKPGDTLCVVDNDSQKRLPGAPAEIEAVCDCTPEAFDKMIRNSSLSSYCKPKHRAFGKVVDGLPWAKFGQLYSIKGFTDEE